MLAANEEHRLRFTVPGNINPEVADGLLHAVEELVGRQVVVVANLKPAKLRGIESQGMLLAASDESGLALVRPERTMAPGARVK